jgi:hypothetical protein
MIDLLENILLVRLYIMARTNSSGNRRNYSVKLTLDVSGPRPAAIEVLLRHYAKKVMTSSLIIGSEKEPNKRKEITMIKTKDTPTSFAGQHFYVGVNVHKKRWSVTIRNNDMRIKTYSMDPSPELLVSQLKHHYPDGVYHIVYEIGFTGFWICRRFRELGMDCITVNPAATPFAVRLSQVVVQPFARNQLFTKRFIDCCGRLLVRS